MWVCDTFSLFDKIVKTRIVAIMFQLELKLCVEVVCSFYIKLFGDVSRMRSVFCFVPHPGTVAECKVMLIDMIFPQFPSIKAPVLTAITHMSTFAGWSLTSAQGQPCSSPCLQHPRVSSALTRALPAPCCVHTRAKGGSGV